MLCRWVPDLGWERGGTSAVDVIVVGLAEYPLP